MGGPVPMSLKLNSMQVDHIREYVKKQVGWSPDGYELEFMSDWDNSRVPIVVGIPSKMKIDFSPIFAILPDGSLSAWDQPHAFEIIITKYFSQVGASDALALAKLSVWFGRFEIDIGELWARDVKGKIPEKHVQRPQFAPVLKINGDGFDLGFYAYDYELLRLSDCTVLMNSGKATFKATKYRRP